MGKNPSPAISTANLGEWEGTLVSLPLLSVRECGNAGIRQEYQGKSAGWGAGEDAGAGKRVTMQRKSIVKRGGQVALPAAIIMAHSLLESLLFDYYVIPINIETVFTLPIMHVFTNDYTHNAIVDTGNS